MVCISDLLQEYDSVYWPVTFSSRTLKPNEFNYGIVDKEVLALLRMLNICYTMIVFREITVPTRYSALAWLLQSSGLNEDFEAASLLNWTLEIRGSEKRADKILGTFAASIVPREEVDEVLIAVAPQKQPRQMINMPPPTVGVNKNLLVASFDGSARVKIIGGAYSAIIWKLPEWTTVAAASEFTPDLTVKELEYRGLLLIFMLVAGQARERVIMCGDSNLVIRQMQG